MARTCFLFPVGGLMAYGAALGPTISLMPTSLGGEGKDPVEAGDLAGERYARQFNASFPKTFPRFVQHAIWRYCSLSGLDVWNGNRIDDSGPCENKDRRVRLMCDRVALR